MKKLFRMALVLALAGSALVYTSCTKDYSPDISSLQDQIDKINTDPNSGLPWVRTQLESLSATLQGLQGKVTIGDDELNNRITKLRSDIEGAIEDINDALDGKADQSYVEDEVLRLEGLINGLRSDLEDRLDDLDGLVEDLGLRLDALDGEEGRVASLEETVAILQQLIDDLDSASEAIEGQFGTYAKFIQSIAYVPGNTLGVSPAAPYKFVTGPNDEAEVSNALLIASFKITPAEARSRATMETSNLVAVKTKTAAAAPDTLEIKKLVYREDAPGYVDVYATVDTTLYEGDPAAFAFAFVVTQTEEELVESVTSDYGQSYLAAPQDILFQIYDAVEGEIVDPETFDDEVRVSPSSEEDTVCVYTAGRWSVVADIDGAYLTPAEAKDLLGASDIKQVSPLAGDTTYVEDGDATYYGVKKKAFESTVGPKNPKKVADLVNEAPIFKLGIYMANSHASVSDAQSGTAWGTYHAVPDTVAFPLTPVNLYGQPEEIIFAWDYKYYDDIKDSLISKIKVDGDRNKLVGAEADSTWNAESLTDYTQGVGTTDAHINDPAAIDKTLCSAAEYGVADSNYVYQIKHYVAEEATLYTGEFGYTVEARPEDAVIEIAIDTMIHFEGPTEFAVEAIKAAYDYHADYYAPYPVDTVAADAVAGNYGASLDSVKVTIDGEVADVAVTGGFGWAEGEETTKFSLNLDQVGEWKVYVYTHFANVAYTFIVTINAENNTARIAPKETYVTVDNPENPKEYSVQVKGDVDTTTWHYYLIDQPFQDYVKVVNYAMGSDSLIIDVQTITEEAIDAVVAPDSPVALARLEADSTVANLADTTNYEWGEYDSLQFKVAVRLVPQVKQETCVDSAAVRLWTVDPIPVFDGGDGIIVEHEKDQLAKTNIIAGINIMDFNGVALNDSTGLITEFGPNEAGEIIVDYDQKLEIGDIELISGADYLEELQLFFDEDDPEVLCLRLNQGVIVTPIVVRIPIKLSYMLDRGMEEKNTVYVYVTFKEKE